MARFSDRKFSICLVANARDWLDIFVAITCRSLAASRRTRERAVVINDGDELHTDFDVARTVDIGDIATLMVREYKVWFMSIEYRMTACHHGAHPPRATWNEGLCG